MTFIAITVSFYASSMPSRVITLICWVIRVVSSGMHISYLSLTVFLCHSNALFCYIRLLSYDYVLLSYYCALLSHDIALFCNQCPMVTLQRPTMLPLSAIKCPNHCLLFYIIFPYCANFVSLSLLNHYSALFYYHSAFCVIVMNLWFFPSDILPTLFSLVP